MKSAIRAETRGRPTAAILILVLLVVAGCYGRPAASPPGARPSGAGAGEATEKGDRISPPPPSPAASRSSPSPSNGPIATVGPGGHGRPYTADMILAALVVATPTWPPDSKPWPTIPPALMTPRIAALIAGLIWTYDGRPYQKTSWEASCASDKPLSCQLRLEGLPPFPSRSGDAYYLQIKDSGDTFGVTVAWSGLGGYPAELKAELDALVRALDVEGRLAGMEFVSAGWLIPPPADAWHLHYRVDKMEGDPKADVILDRANRKILSLVEGVM